MPSWEDLQSWNHAPLERAYDEVKLRQELLEECGADIHRMLHDFNDQGLAADTLRELLNEYKRESDHIEALLTDLMAGVNHAAEEVEKLVKEVHRVHGQILEADFEIDATGRVSDTHEQMKSRMAGIATASRKQDRDEFQERVDRLLDRARDIADRLVHAMDSITADAPSDAAQATSGASTPNTTREVMDAIRILPAAQIRAMWDSMDPGLRQRLLREFPEVLGGLSGIPFAIRAKANRTNAKNYIEEVARDYPNLDDDIARLEDKYQRVILQESGRHEPGTEWVTMTGNELNLLHELHEIRANRDAAIEIMDGTSAILFDPKNDRIATVAGNLNGNVSQAIIYAPGTGTNMQSFANGINDIGKSVSQELRERGQPALVVTVKDGPWSTWYGEGFNGSESEMRERGAKIHAVANDLRLEDYGPNTEYSAIGHSSGMSKIGTAETNGATFDNVISLSGSYVGSSWIADPSTKYTHIQYENDPINALDKVGYRTPNRLHEFTNVHLLSPQGDGIDDHSRISQSSETNSAGIDAIGDATDD